jgi:SAM-dependent methyltransferase
VTRASREGPVDPAGAEPVPWFQAAFGALYPVVYAHRDDAAAESEVQFAKEVLGIGPGQRVLDLACGDGRHLGALSRLGVAAVGMDLSDVLLARARARGLHVVRADLRALPFASASFDHATCFFTSFGYFDEVAENLGVLRGAARVLRPGGRLLLDVPDRDELERGLVARSEFQRAGLKMRFDRAIDRGRVRKKVSVVNGHGDEVARFEESVRVYTLPELRQILEASGFRVVREAGGFDGRPIGQGDRYLIAAEKGPARP